VAEADQPGEGYPPARHLLRDLGAVFERDGDDRRMSLEVVPEILTDRGALDAGIASVIVDMVSGGVAIDHVQPDWIVTSDMALHLARPVRGGLLVGRTNALRVGRNNVVLETQLVAEGEEEPAVVAQLGFTRITRRDDTPLYAGEAPAWSSMALPDSGFEALVYEQLGLRMLDPAAGALELDVADYQRNSVGAMQGGIVVALATKSAESIGRSRLGAPVVTTDLTAHYLALGKLGPLHSKAVVVRVDDEAVVARVELRDRGQDDRLCTVVTATARAFG
jgi:acyl-coenzyme A thioesterase PaaI-like protein